MARMECQYEPDVLTMVYTGQWPERAPAELRAHVDTCALCADLATVSLAIDEANAAPHVPALPSSGIVWWRAQLRARQEAAQQVVRPITVAQAAFLAVVGGVSGAVFGATTDWFQRVLQRFGGVIGDGVAWVRALELPALPSVVVPADMPATLAPYATSLAIVAIGIALATAVVFWALREE